MFHVGQKVVCVDDKFTLPVHPCDRLLRKGGVYTVGWVGVSTCKRDPSPTLGVHLVEIAREPSRPEGRALPYRATRFRPVIERKTDISIFKSMLTPSRVNEPAR